MLVQWAYGRYVRPRIRRSPLHLAVQTTAWALMAFAMFVFYRTTLSDFVYSSSDDQSRAGPGSVPETRSAREDPGRNNHLLVHEREARIEPESLMRAILGVGARAEIVRALLEPGGDSALVGRPGRGDGVQEALSRVHARDDAEGGVVDGAKVRKEIRFRLDRASAWRELLGETPAVWPRWIHILPLLTDVVDALERAEPLSPRLQAVEIHRAAESLLPLVKKAGLRAPRDGDLADRLRPWFENVAFELARANAAVFDDRVL